jgi:carboxyl-terminal processing protease
VQTCGITPRPCSGQPSGASTRLHVTNSSPPSGNWAMVCTSLGQAKLDAQLQDLSAGIFDEREAVVESRAARSPLPVARILELRGNCPAAIGSDADLDAARTLLETPGAYEAALVPVPVERRITE